MQCRACFHRDRDAIDRELIAGVPFRRISRKFDLSLGALSRHKGHVKQLLKERTESEREEHGGKLLDRVETLLGEAQELLESCKSNSDRKAAVAALGAITRILELFGKLSGEIQPSGAVNLNFTSNRSQTTVIGNQDDLAELLATCTDSERVEIANIILSTGVSLSISLSATGVGSQFSSSSLTSYQSYTA